MDWKKCERRKNKIYNFKYREFSGIFTMNPFFGNSIQINMKFTFTAYKYMNACPIIQFDMHILTYIYIYIYLHI